MLPKVIGDKLAVEVATPVLDKFADKNKPVTCVFATDINVLVTRVIRPAGSTVITGTVFAIPKVIGDKLAVDVATPVLLKFADVNIKPLTAEA